MAHIWSTRCWGLGRSTPVNSNFTDPYSKISYLAAQVLADLPPSPNIDFTDSYSESSYLEGQVLTYLLQSPSDFTDPYSKISYLAAQVLADLPPSLNIDFTDSYSESSYLGDQVLGDLLSQMAMSQIPNLRAHIWQARSWQIFSLKGQCHRFLLWGLIFGNQALADLPPSSGNFTDSYSESSYLADQVLVDPPPLSMSQMTISQIPTQRAHVWQARSWQIYPHPAKGFHRFLL